MTQLGEAIARYHKLLEAEPYRDLAWAHSMHERMKAEHLTVGGKPVSPVLRPHFITRRQYLNLSKAAESLVASIDRVEKLALSNPALMARMEMLPAEKMLASLDPGYAFHSVASGLDTHLNNGTLRFVDCGAQVPVGAAYSETLSDIFYDAPPVKEFRKRHGMAKMGGTKPLLQALLKTYKEWGGNSHKPQVGIVEFKQPFETIESAESQALAAYFRKEGLAVEVVAPEQLEYRNNVLRAGAFPINLVFRRVKVQEFLVRYDLGHPLLQAYRDGAICMVNSFRSELSQKKAIFDLLTDENVTAGFPLQERKALREFLPWTRLVSASKTTYQDSPIDLPEFILKNREKLVLRPNDDSSGQGSVRGSEVSESGWEKALKSAMRSPYVVQEAVEPVRSVFPVLSYGELEMREMTVDVHPHSYMGKVQGCSSWLTAGTSGFSSLAGIAPTFVLESR